jgi:hypothetical protein
MKDRSPALLFRSEIEQERAPWVDLTRWRRRRRMAALLRISAIAAGV